MAISRKDLDRICLIYKLADGYKSYLKSPGFKVLSKSICELRPKCQCCQKPSKTIVFSDFSSRSLIGLNPDGIVAVCLLCEHAIRYSNKNKPCSISMQLKRAQEMLANGVQRPSKAAFGHEKMSGTERDEYLQLHGFASFDAYLLSEHFKEKQQSVLKHFQGRCRCCRRQADGVHFRWYSPRNLMTESGHGIVAICSTCRDKIRVIGPESMQNIAKTDRKLHSIANETKSAKEKQKLEKQKSKQDAIQATGGACCLCEDNPAAGTKEFSGVCLPICCSCSGKIDFDKEFKGHMLWFAKTYGKRLSHLKQPQPADKPTPKPPVQTFITKDHSQLPNSPLAMRVKVTKPGNGSEQTLF